MADYDKDLSAKEHTTPHHGSGSDYVDEEVGVVHKSGALNRDLKSRHMQMIAIGTLLFLDCCLQVSSLDQD